MKKSTPFILAIFYFFSVAYLYAASNYALIDLGTMGYDSSFAKSINNRGVIVGDTEMWAPGFKWEPIRSPYYGSRLPFGRVTLLKYDYFPIDDDGYTSLNSINDNNEIVGSYLVYHNTPFIWDNYAGFKAMPVDQCGYGVDINNSSQVIIGINDWEYKTVLCEDDVCRDIVSLTINGIDRSYPFAINDLGQVVGMGFISSLEGSDYWFAFLWKDENLFDLNTEAIIPVGNLILANDINNLEQIIGHYEIDGSYSSFLFSDGEVSDLGFEGATAINDNSQIVGSHFLYDNDGHLYDLNELILNAFGYRCRCPLPGVPEKCGRRKIKYKDLEVNDINNRGQIVGSAIIEGAEHAVLLNPIKLPMIDSDPLPIRPPTLSIVP